MQVFRLLRRFGLKNGVLNSNNAILPILYFVYHKNLAGTIVEARGQEQNRALIKKWILRTIVLQPFGGSVDTVLGDMRRAFIEKFGDFTPSNAKFFDEDSPLFPLEKIEQKAKYAREIGDEFLENLLNETRKKEAFAVLSLLFGDFRNDVEIHIDHMHPISGFEGSGLDKKEYEAKADTLPNLQLLEGRENESKNKTPLKKWVEDNCGDDRGGFLRRHLIPENADLGIENFNDFYEARKALMKERLREIFQK